MLRIDNVYVILISNKNISSNFYSRIDLIYFHKPILFNIII